MKSKEKTCGRSIVHSLCVAVFAVVMLASFAWAGDKVTFDTENAEEETIILDVACDGRTSNVNRVDPSATAAARGDVGIVNGVIYPGGTIPAGFTDTFDLDNPAGGQIGTWVCLNSRGALPAPRGSAVTYYFGLPNFEAAGLITQGFNSHRREGSIPTTHALIGGTGEYIGATGEVREEVIGTNKTGLFNLRYYITIQKQAFKKEKNKK
jgi:hypothetical protein